MSEVATVNHRMQTRDPDVDQLLHPSRFYDRPADVVADELLTIDERRAILSSWASDACSVESNPTLRRFSLGTAPVTFDEIMDALMRLDRIKGPTVLAVRERPGASVEWPT
jgi:hypothetical protein